MADQHRATSGTRVQGAPARRMFEQARSSSLTRDSMVPGPPSTPRRMQASPARSTRRRDRRSSIGSDTSQLMAMSLPQPTLQALPGRGRRDSSVVVIRDGSDEDVVGPSVFVSVEGLQSQRRRLSSNLQLRLSSRLRRPTHSDTSVHQSTNDSLLLPSQVPPEPNRGWWGETDSTPSRPALSEQSQLAGRLAAFRRKLIMSLWPARVILMILGCVAVAIIFGLKLNLNSSIDVMVNHTAMGLQKTTVQSKGLYACPTFHEVFQEGPFLWDETTQGMLMNGYLYGYMGSQIPGAILAERFGAKWVVFSSVVINGVCCVLTPVVATNTEWDMLLLLLMVQGAAGGFIMPAITTLISHWAPSTHRSTFCGIMYGGVALGKAMTVVMTYLPQEHSWERRFYFLVLMTLPWAVLWGLWAHSSPVDSFFIIPRFSGGVGGSERASTSTIEPLREPGVCA